MFETFVKNYEINKLVIENPDMTNFYIFLLVAILCIVTLRKRKTQFLDFCQTDQIKGISILLIIIGHLWVHISSRKAGVVLSGEGVSLFFLLSGYGLTRSNMIRPQTVSGFISKRLEKLLLPYWAATIFILLLDYTWLERTYALNDLLLTFSGINISPITKHIDYARWFITLLLLWYVIFVFCSRWRKGQYFLQILFIASCVVFIGDYYITQFGWYQIFSFFAGCFIGVYYEPIQRIVIKRKTVSGILGIVGVIGVIVLNIFISKPIKEIFPFIFTLGVEEIKSVIFSISVILIVYYLGSFDLSCRFLEMTGKVSYELFLLHGIFLVKYNPFISVEYSTVIGFICYFAFIFFIAYIFQRTLSKIDPISIIGKYKAGWSG